MSKVTEQPLVGIVIVTYYSQDHIEDCITSILGSTYSNVKLVIVDNASEDETIAKVKSSVNCIENQFQKQDWHQSEIYTHNNYITCEEFLSQNDNCNSVTFEQSLAIVKSKTNLGYAAGVNMGLEYLLSDEKIHLIWIINPDCIVQPDTLERFVSTAANNPEFGLIGGRIRYMHDNAIIQSDGGKINRWTGFCSNLGIGKQANSEPYPESKDIDFISGASMFVSREFVEVVGNMDESYFLYYEEVDWAFRHGSYSIGLAKNAELYHQVGASIGSGTVIRQPSSLSNYFNFRSRIKFMRKYFPYRLPLVFFYSFLKALSLILRGYFNEGTAAIRGLVGLRPPDSVINKLGPDAIRVVFDQDTATEN
ncbi:MAG: glycosyltransferase family 2 protein [Alphaproteobacteria bacterium]